MMLAFPMVVSGASESIREGLPLNIVTSIRIIHFLFKMPVVAKGAKPPCKQSAAAAIT